VSFGCVCIPENQTTKGDEALNMVTKSEFGADWFTTQGIFSAAPVSRLLNDYGDICREKGIVPKKVILTFAPCGRPKTMAFIKWLGMYVPEEKEKRILNAEVPVDESVILLNEILIKILEQTSSSGVPLGIVVESLSVFQDEVDAAHDLFQLLQVTTLYDTTSLFQYFLIDKL
jgi:5,10-methylenetetrahydrofolate reductase